MNPLQRMRRILNPPSDLPPDSAALIAQATGLTPIDQTDESDIFICGYPKSGNTWFQHLIAGSVYGCDGEFTSDALVQALVPDVSDVRFYSRFRTPGFFKTHLLPQKHYKRIVHLLRDGRDVMVSYYHHQCAMSGSQVDFLNWVRNGKDIFPCTWAEHAEAYMGLKGADMLQIRYEDLLADPVRELGRFCRFAGLDRLEDFLQSVAKKADFGSLKKKENSPLWEKHPQWDASKRFIRRGVAGSYKDEMPPDVLAAFLDQAGATLHKCGYV